MKKKATSFVELCADSSSSAPCCQHRLLRRKTPRGDNAIGNFAWPRFLAIEMSILEKSLETMRVGKSGWGLERCGYSVVSFAKPKNVATTSRSWSSQGCEAERFEKKGKKQNKNLGSQSSLLSTRLPSNPSKANTSNYCIHLGNLYPITQIVLCLGHYRQMHSFVHGWQR